MRTTNNLNYYQKHLPQSQVSLPILMLLTSRWLNMHRLLAYVTTYFITKTFARFAHVENFLLNIPSLTFYIFFKLTLHLIMGTAPNVSFTTDTTDFSFGENLKILQQNDQICELQTIIRDK